MAIGMHHRTKATIKQFDVLVLGFKVSSSIVEWNKSLH